MKKRSLIKQIFLLILASVATGGALGFWYMPRWVKYTSPDGAFTNDFRNNPIQMGLPKPADYTFVKDDSLKIYSLKMNNGIDEINRLDVLESATANEDWFNKTLSQTGGLLLEGNSADFILDLQKEQAFLRGRIIFAPHGKGIYKIFIVRASLEELKTLDSERFLYSLNFSQ